MCSCPRSASTATYRCGISYRLNGENKTNVFFITIQSNCYAHTFLYFVGDPNHRFRSTKEHQITTSDLWGRGTSGLYLWVVFRHEASHCSTPFGWRSKRTFQKPHYISNIFGFGFVFFFCILKGISVGTIRTQCVYSKLIPGSIPYRTSKL